MNLSHLIRYTASGVAVIRPPSVFVSDGRFGSFIVLAFILAAGSAGFLLLASEAVAGLSCSPPLVCWLWRRSMTGSRGAFVYMVTSSLRCSPSGWSGGLPSGFGEGYRLIKAIRRSLYFCGIGFRLGGEPVSRASSAPLALLSGDPSRRTASTLRPVDRSWDYPVQQLQNAFADPDGSPGHGIGTGSLGAQYVTRILGMPLRGIDWGENGYGGLDPGNGDSRRRSFGSSGR